MPFWIINKLITAYLLSTSIFLLIILCNKASRKRRNVFLNKSNFILAVVLLVNIILAGLETIRCRAAEIKTAANTIQEGIINSNQYCISIFVFTFLFAFLFQSFFFFNKYRTKISFTTISILLLAVFNSYERLVVFITSLYRDYLPSSWATYYNNEDHVYTATFAALYFMVCWVSKPRFKIAHEEMQQ
jgi:hypothetical protein